MVTDSHSDVETFKLFDVKCPVRVEDFQLQFLPSLEFQTGLFLFFWKLAVDGGDQAEAET